ncbi:testis-expressed protein 2-like [Gigantopelta aegis]|uniref:testis-expressed protein 2-like n=1 Tax=Gigantopelta aegis TaxID=1735272 RepID=UPI001B889456|nr:testis-expressed protein 2-like [Gigantopelta aegis]
MSTRKDTRPPRPPPPRQGSASKLSTGGLGISFKSLEEEDEDDLTIFTGKFDRVVEENKIQKACERGTVRVTTKPGPAEQPTLSKHHSSAPALDELDKSSPTKKNKSSVFEYRDILSGIKDKITDTKEKITDTIQKKLEISSDSSSNTSPEKETVEVVKEDKSPNEYVKVEPVDPFAKEEIIEERTSLFRGEIGVKREIMPENDPLLNPPTDDGAFDDEMDGLRDDLMDDIEVIDEYYSNEPMEDFTGSPNISMSVKQRSKLKRLGKKKLQTSATVSMSKLVDSSRVDEENCTPSNAPYSTDSPRVAPSCPVIQQDSANTQSKTARHIPVQEMTAIAMCVFAYYIIPLPDYLSGFVMGCLFVSIGILLHAWLYQPPKPREPFKLPLLEELPPMELPVMKEPVSENGIFKGWMNELVDYNPDDYHISQTHSVYVRLEGTHLRLQRPKVNVPKRAMWDEVIPHTSFIHQRHFELPGSRVFLLPPGLVKKRIWSKKYPIVIALRDLGTKSSIKDGSASVTPTTDPDSGFELVDQERCDNSIIYLFARTGREKEEWFKCFQAAACNQPLGNHLVDLRNALNSQFLSRSARHRRQGSTESQSSTSSTEFASETPPLPLGFDLPAFSSYMARLMPAQSALRLASPTAAKKDGGKEVKDGSTAMLSSGSLICERQLFWINALIGRCFWDFLRDQWWAEVVKEKLQRKLSKIHVPYFIEELQVTHIDIGSEIPAIRRAGCPFLDEKGFWVDLDIAYSGGFKMTIETKINLMKLTRRASHVVSSDTSPGERSAVTDSNEEDSAESSTDEEDEQVTTDDSGPPGSTASKKFLHYLDRLTQSKYFHRATEYKYVKKAMQEVSNTRLILTVEMKNLIGTLAVNIPPPPTDRLWYGFRGNPRLWLVAKPKVGEREVTITHITEWIEKKLSLEFQRVFVMPNMDDLVIPILLPGHPKEAVPVVTKSASTEL